MYLGTHQFPIMLSVPFLVFQLTMPKCHKTYPKCTWHEPHDCFGLNFNSALNTNIYWNYSTHIVRVCASPLCPINPHLHVPKSNLQVKFGSEDMASQYELLCHHFLTTTDPLLEEFFSYLSARCPSHIFDYNGYESSDNESVRSIDSSVSAFYSDE